MQSRSMSVVFFENDWEHTARSGIFKMLDANDERLPSKMIKTATLYILYCV